MHVIAQATGIGGSANHRTTDHEHAATTKPDQEKLRSSDPQASDRTASVSPSRGSRLARRGAAAFYLATILTIFVGWLLRTEEYITAQEGTGYMLGIVGGSMMLLLLLYPLRKKHRFMRFIGSVKIWFRAHMILGIVGPVLVLYHANFQLGSLNSKVATISMIVVAISGLLGRYLYTRIHHGLYGHRITLVELMEDAVSARNDNSSIRFLPRLDEHLLAIEQSVLQPPNSVLRSALRPIFVAISTRWAQFRLVRLTKRELDGQARESRVIAEHEGRLRAAAERHIANRLRKVRRVAEFTFYERVFALWHVLHYPLFIILLVAATVHILAVHMY